MDARVERALKARIKEQGSRVKAAKSMGIHKSMITYLLNGERQPGPKVLEALGFETRITLHTKQLTASRRSA